MESKLLRSVPSATNIRYCYFCLTKILPSYYYADKKGWMCKLCSPKLVPCCNSHLGCKYMDYPCKMARHQFYFCSFSGTCGICKQKIRGTLLEHFGLVHDVKAYRAGERIRPYNAKEGEQLVLTDCGPVVADYAFVNNSFIMDIMAPVPSQILHKFKCTVQLVDPVTDQDYKIRVKENYTDLRDWYIHISPTAFPRWSGILEVGIDIQSNF